MWSAKANPRANVADVVSLTKSLRGPNGGSSSPASHLPFIASSWRWSLPPSTEEKLHSSAGALKNHRGSLEAPVYKKFPPRRLPTPPASKHSPPQKTPSL